MLLRQVVDAVVAGDADIGIASRWSSAGVVGLYAKKEPAPEMDQIFEG